MATVEGLVAEGQKLEAQKRFIEAGALYERAFETDRAVGAYKKGGRIDRAARLLEAGGRREEAAALYGSVGQHAHAAGIYEALRKYNLAARAYLNANQREQAALMCEQGQLFEDAAKIYASLKNFEKAIQLYERAGRADLVAELVQKLPAKVTAPKPSIDLATLLQTPGAVVDERTIVAGLADMLARGEVNEAARLYQLCRDDVGYPLVAALAGKGEAELSLAKMLYAASDFHKAAQVLESLGRFAQAAQLYQRSDDFARAADAYLKAEQPAQAAEMYERAQSFGEAAELFVSVGQAERAAVCLERNLSHFAAGEQYSKAGKADKALQQLQKVRPGDPDYLASVVLMGETLERAGRPDLAVRKYAAVTTHAEVQDVTAPIYYRLAALHHAAGRAGEARPLYDKLLAWDVGYLDVQARLAALGAAPAEAELPLAEIVLEEAVAGPQLVTTMDGIEFLKQTELFSELSLDELRTFYDVAEARQFAEGSVLIEQDRPGEALYVVRQGAVTVKKAVDGAEHVLATLGPGSPVGEMALFDDAPTSARVVAAGEVLAFALSKQRFGELLSGDARLALKIYRVFVRTLVGRLRATSSQKAAQR